MPKYNILLLLFTLVCLVLPSHFDWLLPIGHIDDALSYIFSHKHVKNKLVNIKTGN